MNKSIFITSAFIVLFFCSCGKNKSDIIQSSDLKTETQDSLGITQDPLKNDTESVDSPKVVDNSNALKSKITKEMAYEGVNNYCHSEYDWSIAEENPSIMYVTMGEETESEYQVIFRSYTGSFVYFYVGKTSGTTRMVEHVPSLDVENEIGTIDLFDYIEKK